MKECIIFCHLLSFFHFSFRGINPVNTREWLARLGGSYVLLEIAASSKSQ